MGSIMSIGNPLQAGLSAVQTGVQYTAEGDEGKLEVQRDQQNESLANTAARDSMIRGDIQAGLARIHGSQVAAEQKVAYANSGVTLGEGTPAQTAANTRTMSTLDVMTIQNNAAREAFGYTSKAAQFELQTKMDAARMRNKQTGTLLSGMSKFASAGSSGGGDSGGSDSQSSIDDAFNNG